MFLPGLVFPLPQWSKKGAEIVSFTLKSWYSISFIESVYLFGVLRLTEKTWRHFWDLGPSAPEAEAASSSGSALFGELKELANDGAMDDLLTRDQQWPAAPWGKVGIFFQYMEHIWVMIELVETKW